MNLKNRKIPPELHFEIINSLPFNTRWAFTRVSKVFDCFLLERQLFWIRTLFQKVNRFNELFGNVSQKAEEENVTSYWHVLLKTYFHFYRNYFHFHRNYLHFLLNYMILCESDSVDEFRAKMDKIRLAHAYTSSMAELDSHNEFFYELFITLCKQPPTVYNFDGTVLIMGGDF